MSAPTADVSTSYASRRLDLPPLVAQAAYDVAVSASAEQGWQLRSATGCLRLHGPVRVHTGSGWWPLRSQLGVVTVGLHRWPVELELLPWSSTRTELGLRPMSRRSRARPPESVIRAGHDLLDRLTSRLRGNVDEPVQELCAETRAVESQCDGVRTNFTRRTPASNVRSPH